MADTLTTGGTPAAGGGFAQQALSIDPSQLNNLAAMMMGAAYNNWTPQQGVSAFQNMRPTYGFPGMPNGGVAAGGAGGAGGAVPGGAGGAGGAARGAGMRGGMTPQMLQQLLASGKINSQMLQQLLGGGRGAGSVMPMGNGGQQTSAQSNPRMQAIMQWLQSQRGGQQQHQGGSGMMQPQMGQQTRSVAPPVTGTPPPLNTGTTVRPQASGY